MMNSVFYPRLSVASDSFTSVRPVQAKSPADFSSVLGSGRLGDLHPDASTDPGGMPLTSKMHNLRRTSQQRGSGAYRSLELLAAEHGL